MELRISEYQLPAPVGFNFEELKAEIEAQTAPFANAVYSNGDIKTARADRAKLNKLKKAINDRRIELEREYMTPFADFKAKVNETISIVETAAANVDREVKRIEAELKPAEDEPERAWVKFEARVGAAEAKALGAFLKSAGIEYRRLK